MSINNKDFKVKNGLQVAGTAVFNSDVILGETPMAFDITTNRIKIYVNGEWVQIATLADADVLTFEDIGVSVDYDGQATYIIQGNGVSPSDQSKFIDGGGPSTTSVRYVFDSQVIQ
jgi:hypothetical protein